VETKKRYSIKQAVDSNWPQARKAQLTAEQIDALIEQLREIARANLELIESTESAQAEAKNMRHKFRLAIWGVVAACALDLISVIAAALWHL
jgi:predicted nucleic acid-binding protein